MEPREVDKKNSPAGLGLGLLVVQGIVSAHGGSIEVRSSEEEGTTFEIRLPRHALVGPQDIVSDLKILAQAPADFSSPCPSLSSGR